MEPTTKQKATLRKLGEAQAAYHLALDAYEQWFARAVRVDCSQSAIATELGISRQAVHVAVKRLQGTAGRRRVSASQGTLFDAS